LVDVLPLCSSDPGQDRRDRAARRALRVCSKLNLGESTACHDGDTIRIFWKAGTLVLRPDAVVWEFPERGYSNTQWVQGMTRRGWLSQDYKPEG
jgi:hypothetical protein